MVHFFKWATAVLYAIAQGVEITANHWPSFGPFDTMETPEKNNGTDAGNDGTKREKK
jgi:hypothetical protein